MVKLPAGLSEPAGKWALRAVAVFSDADKNALHVEMADEAIHIGGECSGIDSYLNIEKVIGAAQKTGADAIHPGYGFLAENADFAQVPSSRQD